MLVEARLKDEGSDKDLKIIHLETLIVIISDFVKLTKSEKQEVLKNEDIHFKKSDSIEQLIDRLIVFHTEN